MTDLQTATSTRTFPVRGMRCDGCEKTVADRLLGMNGIEAVEADHRRGRVRVTYRLRDTRMERVAEELASLGYPLTEGWLDRLRYAWGRFTEQNAVDNLKHVPHCCNKPPSGA